MLGADEQGSPHHEVLRDADDLGGMPVVIADLHSALPGDAGRRCAAAADPAVPRVAYVMLDGGALPAWFSRTCAGLREAGWLRGTVTVGPGVRRRPGGGDRCTPGCWPPGTCSAPTSSSWPRGRATWAPAPGGGSPGWPAGEAVNAAAVLGGRPVAALRVSEADPRERHHGRVAPQPDRLRPGRAGPGRRGGARAARRRSARGWRRRPQRWPTGTSWSACSVDGLDEALRGCPVRLSTMGRGLDEDLAYFLAAAAAGRHAAALLPERPASTG